MLIKKIVRQSEEGVEEKLTSKGGAGKRVLVEETLFEIQIMFVIS